MIVITVTRKPIEGTVARNALKWGCGSFNIQGTRIAHGTDVDMEAVQRQSVAPAIDFGGSGLIGKEIMIYKPGGRWPANVIFSHLSGCTNEGFARVEATSTHGTHTAIRRSGVHSEAGGHQTIGHPQPVTGYADADGKEMVPSWSCKPGCPVAALNEQSGIVPTGTWNRQTDTAHPFGDAQGTPYETWQESPKEAPSGASRYFKVVGKS